MNGKSQKMKKPSQTKKDIAEEFNKHFVDKISDLKEKIDPNRLKDPLEKLQEKMASKNLNFELKTVSEATVKKAMKNMQKKKSAGKDGVSQECLLLGKDVLSIPLTRIINSSITSGIFPEEWKESIVCPILKKGTPLSLRTIGQLAAL